MGHYRNNSGIECFEPDNDEKTLWIEADYRTGLREIFDAIRNHFGDDIDFSEISITAEHIHTRCLGYDRYDGSDYTNYLKITKD